MVLQSVGMMKRNYGIRFSQNITLRIVTRFVHELFVEFNAGQVMVTTMFCHKQRPALTAANIHKMKITGLIHQFIKDAEQCQIAGALIMEKFRGAAFLDHGSPDTEFFFVTQLCPDQPDGVHEPAKSRRAEEVGHVKENFQFIIF